MNFVMPNLTSDFYLAALPVFILAMSSMVALLQSVSKVASGQKAVKAVHFIGLLAALVACFYTTQIASVQFLNGSYVMGHLAVFGQGLVLSIALICSLYFAVTHQAQNFFRGEVTSLFQMALMGMLVMISASELISLFIGLELASIGLYALIGYIKPGRASKEGAVKYLVLGSFASGFLLFGFAFLYAGTGTMNLDKLVYGIQQNPGHVWVQVGALLTMVGLGFKLALAPFHMWAPDAYEAAPTGLTAFMATAVKVMVVIVMLRFISQGFEQASGLWQAFFMFTAVLSTIVGNVLALVQSSLKRMLAYSSVSHAGYLAIGLCAVGRESVMVSGSAIVFYLVVYSLISLGAFGILMYLESKERENIQLEDIAGLAKKHPWTAFALAAFMFSFAGIPPTAGFMSKLFIFNAAILEGLYGLVVIGLIGAVISVYYYLRVIVKMYMEEPSAAAHQLAPQTSRVLIGIVSASLAFILLLGTFFPGQLMSVAKMVTSPLLNH